MFVVSSEVFGFFPTEETFSRLGAPLAIWNGTQLQLSSLSFVVLEYEQLDCSSVDSSIIVNEVVAVLAFFECVSTERLNEDNTPILPLPAGVAWG
jgi:hypothetical protein